MKKLILFLLTVTAITTYGQTCEQADNSQKPKKVIKVQDQYESGAIKGEGKLKLHDFPAISGGCCSGRGPMTAYTRHGRWVEYYENGQKKAVVVYTAGHAKKVKKQWDEDGTRVEIPME